MADHKDAPIRLVQSHGRIFALADRPRFSDGLAAAIDDGDLTHAGQVHKQAVAGGIRLDSLRVRFQLNVRALACLAINHGQSIDAPANHHELSIGRHPNPVCIAAHGFTVQKFESLSVVRAQSPVGSV